jgi:hypothetical protein
MAGSGDHGKVHGARAPAMITVSCHPIEEGWTPPPTSPRSRPGGVLLCTSDCLGLLLVRCSGPTGANRQVAGEAPHPGGGSWIAGKATSPHGRMDWRLLSTP